MVKSSCRRRLHLATVAMAALLAAMTASAHRIASTDTIPDVRPLGRALQVDPHFSFDKKTRRSVSGIACELESSGRRCLVVFDEGTEAQFALVHPGRIEPIGPRIALTGAGGELDAEGAAMADGFYYVAGSHAVKRKSCQSNPASRMLVRFKAEASADSPRRIEVTDLRRTTRLWELMLQEPYLRSHADGCLGEGTGGSAEQSKRRPGLNIEGIAVAGGRLYAGFRAPSEDGRAPVYSVDAQALFEGGDPAPRLFRLPLGANIGIRDMVATHDSLLLLLGPDDHETRAGARWTVAVWKPGAVGDESGQVRMLASLDVRKNDIGEACFEALKPEALAVLDESASHYRVVVLSDGVCDGGPLLFDIPK